MGIDMSDKMMELTLMLAREEWYKQQKLEEQNREAVLAMLRAAK